MATKVGLQYAVCDINSSTREISGGAAKVVNMLLLYDYGYHMTSCNIEVSYYLI